MVHGKLWIWCRGDCEHLEYQLHPYLFEYFGMQVHVTLFHFLKVQKLRQRLDISTGIDIIPLPFGSGLSHSTNLKSTDLSREIFYPVDYETVQWKRTIWKEPRFPVGSESMTISMQHPLSVTHLHFQSAHVIKTRGSRAHMNLTHKPTNAFMVCN